MKHWLVHNWGLKIISLVLAIGTWYYAVGEENIEVTRVIPLKIQMSNKEMTVSEISTKGVQVTLSAPRALIVNLASQDIQVVHKIGPEIKTAGEYSFRLEPSEISLPGFQIRVVKIVPEIMTVKLDELIVQKLEIQPDFVGEPAVGYKLLTDELRMDPNAILTQGPKGVLEKMKSAKTEPIDLVGRIRSFHRTVEVKLPSGVTPMSESLVNVYIPIREEFGEKEFKDVPVRVLRSPAASGVVDLNPDKVTLVLRGSKLYLEKLASETLLAYVDLADLKKGDYDLSLQVVLPESVSLKDKEPIKIKAAIRSLTQ
ncbi:MAG: CdaR family protein [Candidatus Omnitrophota bacterium]